MVINFMITILEFIKKHWKGILIAIPWLWLCFSVRSCYSRHLAPKNSNLTPSAPILKPDQKEVIKVDTNHKIITITTPTGTKKIDDSHGATIIEKKDGSITVDNKEFGFQLHPYAGIGGSNKFRVFGGVDWFYFWKFNLGTGVNSDCKAFENTRVDLNLSYNFYSNTDISVSIDNNKTVGMFLKFHF